MSTEYPVIDDGGDYELYLDEASSKATLTAFHNDLSQDHVIKRDMDARELARIGLEFLKVASYLDGDLVEALKDQDSWTLGELRTALK